MANLSVEEALRLGVEHHQAGRLVEAEGMYRRVLAVRPQHADALHLLGVIAMQAGQLDAAVDLIGRAIAIKPAAAELHEHLGEAYRRSGRLKEAIDSLRRSIELAPKSPTAQNSLGIAFRGNGNDDDAIIAFNKAIELLPSFGEAFHNLAGALRAKGKSEDAIGAYRRAIALQPYNTEGHKKLAETLQAEGKLNEAITCLGEAIQANPDNADLYNLLGLALKQKGQLGHAIAAWLKAIELHPKYAEAYNNLGAAALEKHQFDEAVAAYSRAIELKASLGSAHYGMGLVMNSLGRIDEALACYEKSLAISPDERHEHSNLLYVMHLRAGQEHEKIFQEHRRWDELHAVTLRGEIQLHKNEVNEKRRLRIGYVSPDFREHSVARFIETPFSCHDSKAFEIYCYSDLESPDAVTERLKILVNQWRDITLKDDQQVAQQIREDQIDILVDLAGHTENNRLIVFALKPAPVQVTWLGYPDTTGLSAIDYRITDAYADPPGTTEQFHSEQLVRLPDSFLCFRPVDQTLSVGRRSNSKPLTFGSFNNFLKINAFTVAMWSKILRELPQSRMIIKSRRLEDLAAQKRLLVMFGAENIAVDRLELRAALPSASDHLRQYDEIDIALDTFPYHGTTTTCEALWMGVPVITLAGDSHWNRVGASILSNIGMPNLVAFSPDQYVRIVTELAEDRTQLAQLQGELRDRMLHSPLMDGRGFTVKLEAAYRWMWRRWCAKSNAETN